jgi:hypothetical protein
LSEIDRSEFRRWVRNGLGRAVLYLQQNDPAPYIDVIVDACLQNRVYDEQVNGRRGHYLWELIKLSNSELAIRDHLIDALEKRELDETDDWTCIPPLLRRFAQHGDVVARDALYNAMRRDPLSFEFGEAIVKLDGFDGLLALAHQVGSLPGWDGEDTEGVWAMQYACERFGSKNVSDALEAAAVVDPFVERFFDPWREKWRRPFVPGSACRVPAFIRFDEIRQAIERQVSSSSFSRSGFTSSDYSITYYNWGTGARLDDLLEAASFIQELDVDDRDRLSRYLRIFQRRAFPLEITPLLQIVERHADAEGRDTDNNDRSQVTWCALGALEQIPHPNVRELAFELRERSDRWRGNWIGLLRNNYETGDDRKILESVRREFDDDAVHHLSIDILDLLEEQNISEFTEALEILYDRNPCAYCRGNIVKALHEVNGLPDWIIVECRYDSDEGTRAFVREFTG